MTEPKVVIITYGVKTGKIPINLDAVIDCRMIQNPAAFSGDAPDTTRVKDWVQHSEAYPGVLTSALGQSLYAIRRGKPVRVGVHCAWGVHRSRVVAADLQVCLNALGISTEMEHV